MNEIWKIHRLSVTLIDKRKDVYIMVRRVDTREYLSELKRLVNEGHEVSMLIVGSSMAPFLIHERDTIWFKKPNATLVKGDMVFYQRENGQYVKIGRAHV